MKQENAELEQQVQTLNQTLAALSADMQKLQQQDALAITALHEQLQLSEQQVTELLDDTEMLRDSISQHERTISEMSGATRTLEQQRDQVLS